MTLTDAHIEGFPHVEFILGGDYDEFCKTFLMQPIGSWFDDFQAPSQPPITRSSRASGPSSRTPRRRPQTDPCSCTPVEGPSQTRPSRMPVFREVSLENVDRLDLPPEDITEADADDEVGTGEEIVLAPRIGEIGQSLPARDDSEDVAPRRQRDT
ncbi:hypothetical protein JCGZ_20111 [Jatropha curcas]|uniref:Uncharacterized protein n=1 Tax=Jatropha curcas TaxID=180498 RepID=A0A067K766_JATCU|nr:hypothetical protein JCGZ_20111 [Jatropha curcas]